ncbi:MAG TPA: Crp/Fnr family transcriptional regulator [Verrucomicrobiota bacterium]|nr:Crp/Fnr family transcriptional regulator [Verrucomicrobiota bacterium]HNU51186.1 Crp/Fnr family transcriptional regulator [Verrucomicrobiota bacterium]
MLTSIDCLKGAPPTVLREFEAEARTISLAPDRLLLSPGEACAHFGIVISGALRVTLLGPSHREAVLYRVLPGESCVLTAASILGSSPFPAVVAAEGPTSVASIPAPTFRSWTERHPFWRAFVFRLLAERLAEVLARVQCVSAEPLEARIARVLLGLSHDAPPVVSGTLLAQFGQEREAARRLLDRWARTGWLDLVRGGVLVRRREPLERIAHDTR